MDRIGLLEDCRSYFQRAQASWDKYFSKWEAMPKEEENVQCNDNLLSDLEVETVRRLTRRDSAARQVRQKSISVMNRKRFKSNRERKTKWKRERVQGGKARDRKQETEIIHTTENQTNLECEVVNNKHFEADLKAIFIEILSENINKMGMFSVLSRTFSGAGETISNFSLSSMIMEKNGFSISPVGKTVLHSASCNEFPLGRIPGGEISDAVGRSCVNLTQRFVSNVSVLRVGHLSNVNDTDLADNSFPLQNHRLVTNDRADDKTECREYINREMLNVDSLLRLSTPTQAGFSRDGCSRKTDFVSRSSFSEASRRKICQTAPSTTENMKKSVSERVRKTKRSAVSVFEFSDDSEEEEIDSSPGKILRIFCTPKRPKRSIERDESKSEIVKNGDDDDDDCFTIFDRVKTDKN